MGYAKAEAEASIVSLAQMSRAVGIHLIVTTDRPSIDVVTGMLNVSLLARRYDLRALMWPGRPAFAEGFGAVSPKRARFAKRGGGAPPEIVNPTELRG